MPSSIHPRLQWLDAAKGVCMILVVLLHSSGWLNSIVPPGSLDFWWEFSSVLIPLSMPLFFFISGFLAARSLEQPLARSRAKTVGLYYLYVLWTMAFLARLWVPGFNRGSDLVAAAVSILLPTAFWYLWALGSYFLVARGCIVLMGKFSIWALVPLGLLSVAAPVLSPEMLHLPTSEALEIESVARNLLWFYAGVHLKTVWVGLLDRGHWARLAGGIVVYAAIYIAAQRNGLLAAAMVLLSAVALFTAAQALALLPMDAAIGRALQWVGRLTLPVYIFHIFAISLMSAIWAAVGLRVNSSNAGTVLLIVPPLLAVVLTVASRVVGSRVLNSRLRWLLSAPSWLVAPRA